MINRYTGRLSHLLQATFIALLISLLGLSGPASAQSDLNNPADLETFLDGVMAVHLESHNIPGATLTIVHNGEMLLAKGYGYANLARREEVDPARTLFRPGSVSKLVTWTAVMQLVEQGELDLHTDVNEYLDFTIPATFPEPITLAHLMTHTPGFEDVSEGLFVLTEDELITLDEYIKERLPRRVYPPGQVGAYSNYGTALAGYIVERISGMPFAAYVEQHIFSPLGMDQSTFRQPLPAELTDQLATGYGFYNGHYVHGGFEFVTPYPAGAMSTPATDMAAFMIAHLQMGRYGDTAILQPSTVQTMHSRQYSADPRLHGMTYGFMEQRINGHAILHHGGDTFLFHSGLYLLPEENLGLFVSYNSAGGTFARDELLRAFMDRYYPVSPPADLTPPPDAAASLATFTGEYHAARADYSTAAKILRILEPVQVSATPEGILLVTLFGRVEPYVEVEPALYRHLLRDDLLLFQYDASGILWLLFDGNAPFAFFQPPWYVTFSTTMLLLIVTLLLFIGSMIGWLISTFSAWGQKMQRPRVIHLARWVATAFGLLLLIFLLGFANVFGDIAPAYGVPRIFFGETPALKTVMWMPLLLVISVIALLVITLLAWLGLFTRRRADWSLVGRLHYTLLTGLALAVTLSLWYWNLVALPS